MQEQASLAEPILESALKSHSVTTSLSAVCLKKSILINQLGQQRNLDCVVMKRRSGLSRIMKTLGSGHVQREKDRERNRKREER